MWRCVYMCHCVCVRARAPTYVYICVYISMYMSMRLCVWRETESLTHTHKTSDFTLHAGATGRAGRLDGDGQLHRGAAHADGGGGKGTGAREGCGCVYRVCTHVSCPASTPKPLQAAITNHLCIPSPKQKSASVPSDDQPPIYTTIQKHRRRAPQLRRRAYQLSVGTHKPRHTRAHRDTHLERGRESDTCTHRHTPPLSYKQDEHASHTPLSFLTASTPYAIAVCRDEELPWYFRPLWIFVRAVLFGGE